MFSFRHFFIYLLINPRTWIYYTTSIHGGGGGGCEKRIMKISCCFCIPFCIKMIQNKAQIAHYHWKSPMRPWNVLSLQKKKKNRVNNNSLHLWSEEFSLVEEWISLDSNSSRVKIHYSTSGTSSGSLDIHSKRSDHRGHSPGSDLSDK